MIDSDIRKIIKVVKENPCLYDKRNANFKNIKLKKKLWNSIAEKMEFPVDQCKKKWKALRDCFFRELKTKKKSTGNTTWKYFEDLAYLANAAKFENIKVSYESNGDIIMEEILLPHNDETTDSLSRYNNQQQNVVPPPVYMPEDMAEKKERPPDYNHEFLETLISTRELIKRKIDEPQAEQRMNDEDELFCRSMFLKIKKFPLKQKNEAKIKILSYLVDIENNLS